MARGADCQPIDTPVQRPSLLAVLATFEPIEEEFPDIPDHHPTPDDNQP